MTNSIKSDDSIRDIGTLVEQGTSNFLVLLQSELISEGYEIKEGTSPLERTEKETLSMFDPEVVILGGPTSGHRGHKGVPGVRGGSAPSNRYSSMIFGSPGFEKVSEAKTFDWLHVTKGIPDNHVEGLKDVIVQGNLHGGASSGYYSPMKRTIYLDPEAATGITITHELGHFFWERNFRGPKGGKAADIIIGEFSKFSDSKPSSSDFRRLGLRQYSIQSRDEFWADSYSLFARATGGDERCKGNLDWYRIKFPETSKILDGLFT